ALTRELKEAQEQQTATSEVLKVISSSPGELDPVFNALLANATRICEATFGGLFLREGALFRAVAIHSKESYDDYLRRNPVIDVRENPGTPLDRVANSKQVLHIPDLRTDQSYIGKNRFIVRLVETVGTRTFVSVPMLKEGELIGAINMYRQEVRPFTDRQIELVKNFAAQAVIAIENTRLLNELRQRTGDLSEALEQQTATSEVLSVISSSQGDLDPVFQAMLENAVRICDASFGMLFRIEQGLMRAEAMVGVPPKFAEFWQRGPQRPGSRTAAGRIVETRQPVHVVDVRSEPAYVEGEPVFVAAVNLGGFRTLLNVPMLKDNELVGIIAIYRQEVRPFTNKQVELLSNFAAQAVIAIENTRLLNELRESLQQQTATADVLKVISSSPGELEPVFQAMLENATKLCEASYGLMWLREGDAFRSAALHGDLPQAYLEQWRSGTLFRPGPHVLLFRVAISGEPLQVADLRTDASYLSGDPLPVAAADVAGVRTLFVVPMLRDKKVVGVIGIYRKEVKPFTEKQIDLVKNFAAQAVIAIENTRLLSELRESLQQQTATADVLKVISSSPGALDP
ncbi:MAG: GAF domain-containing protein, partial [Pseudolabrys sp.]